MDHHVKGKSMVQMWFIIINYITQVFMEIMEFSLQVTYCMTVSSPIPNHTFIMFSHVFVNHDDLLKMIVINQQRFLFY